jgi:hypothetical protein
MPLPITLGYHMIQPGERNEILEGGGAKTDECAAHDRDGGRKQTDLSIDEGLKSLRAA